MASQKTLVYEFVYNLSFILYFIDAGTDYNVILIILIANW